ncbi:MAG: CRISPR-associated helicase Cas3' [Rubrobacter sp.]|nr:CRISPR-associated helicase Cas3' [Rubrobacter sp.]
MTFLARPADEREGVFREAEPLKLHLETVAERARRSLRGNLALPDGERLSELASICGLTHDFGKYTSYFQNKLPPNKQEPPVEEYGHHAFVSALLGAFVVRSRYPNDPEAALLVYLAIHRHHGNLVTPSEVLPRSSKLSDAPEFYDVESSLGRQLRAVHEQLKDIRKRGGDVVLEEMHALGISEVEKFLDQERWWEALGELRRSYDDLMRSSSDESAVSRRYWRQLLLFSALIDADKHVSAAAGLEAASEEARSRRAIPSSLVDQHIAGFKPNPKPGKTERRLNEIRQAVYAEGVSAVERLPLEELHPGILSLTAPTGSGKTLTALGCALRLRERVRKEKGYLPRIVYALPFVNIIDQNFAVVEEVLKRHADYDHSPSSYLLKHHHLASQAFREDQDVTNDEALLLTESWESEIVVTTFVQLFESLVTNRNRRLKKLHNLAGAIVVLDEVQSIPYEQWRLVEYTLNTLTEQLGCTVLQMTATRPHILPGARELLDRPEKHFEGLSRTTIIPRPDVRTPEDLESFCKELIEDDSSLLVVLNTIGDAVTLYRKLRELPGLAPYRENMHRDNRGDRPLVHLSTNLTPWQRARRVRMLRRYMKLGGRPVVISTQVVEAGVDLDFDVVVRDRGPLDSMVQVAGRGNRAGASETPRPVYIIYLESDQGSPPVTLVYGNILPQITHEVLNSPVEEADMYDKIIEYFSLVSDRSSGQLSKDFVEAMKSLRFHEHRDDRVTVGKYQHIEYKEQVSILVGVNESAEKAIERLSYLYQKGGNRHEFREAYRAVGPFVITPYARRAEKNLPVEHETIPDHRYIPGADIRSDDPIYFDMETGFKWNDLGAAIL